MIKVGMQIDFCHFSLMCYFVAIFLGLSILAALHEAQYISQREDKHVGSDGKKEGIR